MYLPISIKGVVFKDDKVILLKNERDEWELPGGRLEPGETAETCVSREIEEELGLKVSVEKIIDSWIYTIAPGKSVFIVSYLCKIMEESEISISHEHKEVGLFKRDDIRELPLPEGYKRTILHSTSL